MAVLVHSARVAKEEYFVSILFHIAVSTLVDLDDLCE